MRAFLALLLLTASLAGCTAPSAAGDPADLPVIRAAADFDGGTGWIGTEPLDLEGLRGQVVLVDFWTYSCVNCIRTLPHVTAWDDAYGDRGLVIVGVHSPEFDFEKERSNVIESMDRFGIDYPVVQDNDFGIWRDYSNRYWPAKYLIDAEGQVRYTHFGEGSYEETEQNIRALLAEAGHTDLPDPVEPLPSNQGDRGSDITPELYAGTWRQDAALGNDEGYSPDETVSYQLPPATDRDRHKIYLGGDWFNGEEYLEARSEGAMFTLEFRAGAANFVADGPMACIGTTLDGTTYRADRAGPDVDLSSDPACIHLDDVPRSYDFYAGPVETHEVQFQPPLGFRLYTFAFSHYDTEEPQ